MTILLCLCLASKAAQRCDVGPLCFSCYFLKGMTMSDSSLIEKTYVLSRLS